MATSTILALVPPQSFPQLCPGRPKTTPTKAALPSIRDVGRAAAELDRAQAPRPQVHRERLSVVSAPCMFTGRQTLKRKRHPQSTRMKSWPGEKVRRAKGENPSQIH